MYHGLRRRGEARGYSKRLATPKGMYRVQQWA